MKTCVQLPNDISSDTTVRRVFSEIILNLDNILGYRGDKEYVDNNTLFDELDSLRNSIDSLEKYIDSPKEKPIEYKQDIQLLNDRHIVYKKFCDDRYASSINITQLTQTISDPPTQEEVENIQNKLNTLISDLMLN